MGANSAYDVYTTETDLSQRVAAASTSIGAIVGESAMGPVGEKTFVTDTTEFARRFGKRNPKYGFSTYAANMFLQESNQLYFTRLVNGALTAGAYLTVDDPSAAVPNLVLSNFDDGGNTPLGIEDPLANLGFTPATPGVENILLYFVCANPGEWNNHVSIRVAPTNPAGVPIGQNHNVFHFRVEVYLDYNGPGDVPVETFVCSRSYEIDGEGNQLFVEDVINENSQYIRVRNNEFCDAVEIRDTAFEFLAGATDGDRVTDAQLVEAWEGYAETDELTVNILISGGYTQPNVQTKMNEIAMRRGDSFAFLDVPSDKQDVSSAIAYRRNDLNINSSYSGLYSPDIQIYDEDTGRKLYVPLSGKAAALAARTDANFGVQYVFAGLKRGSIRTLGLREVYGQGARDALDPAQINPVRKLNDPAGYFLWGNLTQQSFASAFSEVHIRRVFNFIKSSARAACRSGLFDPNDEFLRAFLRRLVTNFLKPLVQDRSLYEFEVVCDDRNNTNATIATGDLIMDIYADPVRAAKRIHITANLSATGAKFFEDA